MRCQAFSATDFDKGLAASFGAGNTHGEASSRGRSERTAKATALTGSAPRAALAFGQRHQAALKIDMLPFQFEDFRQPRAREQQRANRRQRGRTDRSKTPFFPGEMLHIHAFAFAPGEPGRFRVAQGAAKARELVSRKEALAGAFGITGHHAAGVRALRYHAP